MKAYMVGGAVRDALLGRASTDQDWVVVGSTPQEMLQAGFIAVGRDFPVFLHPQTKQEYALARTERKTAPGYHGFTFHADAGVTLEQDLARRDLTINAMAFDENGALIDPYGGHDDLWRRVLRHVSPAFAEDPVRILRLARFAARLDEFSVAPETLVLARHMVNGGEVDALVPERVWQELARGLMETRPTRMFEVLRECGALARLMPEVDRLWGHAPEGGAEPGAAGGLLRALDACAHLHCALPERFACLGHAIESDRVPALRESPVAVRGESELPALSALCDRLRVPAACRELGELAAREFDAVRRAGSMPPVELLKLLERCDALRRPQRFELLLLASECIARGTGMALHDGAPNPCEHLRRVLSQVLGVDTAGAAAQAAAQGNTGPEIGQAIRAARLRAISGSPIT
jgi:tRNA nucleotidyltransferase (CCA-adding enzyme)